MSSTVKSYGYFAVLKTDIRDDEDFYENWSEKFYDANSCLSLNYEGTLIFIDYNSNQSYKEREDIYGITFGNADKGINEFIREVNSYGLELGVASIQPYNCIWYNGVDSDMSSLTLEEYQTVLENS